MTARHALWEFVPLHVPSEALIIAVEQYARTLCLTDPVDMIPNIVRTQTPVVESAAFRVCLEVEPLTKARRRRKVLVTQKNREETVLFGRLKSFLILET